MSNEISASFQWRVNNGALQDSKSFSFTADQALARAGESVQNIPTTPAGGTALVFPAGITTLGIGYFINLDATNFVDVGVRDGSGNFIPFARIRGGAIGKKQGAQLPLVPGTTYYAKADTAAVDLQFGALNA